MIYIASLAFLSGVLSFLSPCVLPLAPLYIAYFSGTSSNDEGNRARLWRNLLAFFIGFTAIYLLLGVSFSLSFAFIQNYYFFHVLLGIIMILFAFHYWKIIRVPFIYVDTRKLKVKKFNFISSLFFGFLFAFGWSPCMGPLLGNVIILASNSNGLLGKIFVLLIFCLGIILPFIVIAFMSNGLKIKLQSLAIFNRYIEFFSGVLLFIVGIWLLL